jgi:hypothetical protein
VTKPPQQRCSIGLSRGYLKAQFYVREQGRSESLWVSQPFRAGRLPWRDGKPAKQDPNARAALAALEADLLAEGWERMRRARGAEWYELRFRREKSASLIRYAHQRG